MVLQINDPLTTKVGAVHVGLSFAHFKKSRVHLHTPQPQMMALSKAKKSYWG
jgi:hypothetical protein